MFVPFESHFTFCISSDALSFIVVKSHFEFRRETPAVSARASRPCQSTAEILFARTSQAKMKSATRVVTGVSRQTSHASGMEAALTRRDLRRARDISNSLDPNLTLSPIR
jgi:hypothetical protein